MTSREIYKRFLLKINANDSNTGINILPSHFVLEFNDESLKWLSEEIKNNSDNALINDIKELLIFDEEVQIRKQFSDSIDFILPVKFYKHVSSYTLCDKDCCKNQKVFNFEKNPIGFHTSLLTFDRGDFDFEEQPCAFGKDTIKVFFTDYKITKGFVTYYKEPDKIDIKGYTKIDGSISEDSNTDLSDLNIEKVLSRMSVENFRKYQDTESVMIAKDRIATEP